MAQGGHEPALHGAQERPEPAHEPDAGDRRRRPEDAPDPAAQGTAGLRRRLAGYRARVHHADRDGARFRNTLRAFKALLKDAELPDIRLHDLRHSCATLLLAQGVNPRVVQDGLGHSAIHLTRGTYSHVLPALAEEAAPKIDSALTR